MMTSAILLLIIVNLKYFVLFQIQYLICSENLTPNEVVVFLYRYYHFCDSKAAYVWNFTSFYPAEIIWKSPIKQFSIEKSSDVEKSQFCHF